MKIDDMRRDYHPEALLESALDPDPYAQFRQWFTEAREGDLVEPNAMTLATVSGEGRPACRTVLLKAFDERGFVFFTNYGSRKAEHMEGNPAVALLFPWLALARQVEIDGAAEKISTAESLAYFASRPFGSRLGAWVSDQSKVISSRNVLRAKFDEMCKKFASGEIPKPDFWGGYRVVPRTIEFWQGGPDRLHDRFRYTRQPGGDWLIERLSP